MTPEPGASAALAHRIAPHIVDAGAGAAAERPIEADQTNVSVVVGDAVVVKWLDPPVPQPHPGVEVMAHLREVGFDEMPAFYGAHEVDGEVVALVTSFMSGAVDGWEWFVDELLAWCDVADSDDTYESTVLTSSRRLGALAARLHAALATPSSIVAEPVATVDVALTEARRCHALLDEALTIALGDARELLVARAERIRSALAPLDELGVVAAQRVHGDLHVGQMLRNADRLAVTDFDGNPVADPAARRERRPVAADVASLLQSVDHAGRVAARRRPDTAERLDPLIDRVVAATHQSYRSTLVDLAACDLLDERLLWPLRVAQELHELVYAARHLPRWTYAPVATLTAMFPQE